MRRILVTGLAAFLAWGLTGPARAEDRAPAREESDDTKEAYGVAWQPTLAQALAEAAPAEGRAAKPVFWMRVLGDRDGLT